MKAREDGGGGRRLRHLQWSWASASATTVARKRKLISAVLSLALLSGCQTTLSVREFNGQPQTGILYALSMTQYDVKVTWRIASCEADGSLKFATRFQLAKKHVEDPEAMFVIDPKSLSSFWNSASAQVEFHEGDLRIRSFNGAVADNGGPASESVVKAVAGVLSVLPTENAAATEALPEVKVSCERVNRNIQAVEKHKSAVQRLTESLNRQMRRVVRAAAARTALLPGSDCCIDTEVASAVRHLGSLKAQLRAGEAELERALGAITFVREITWPEKGSENVRTPIEMPEKAFVESIGMTYMPDPFESATISVDLKPVNQTPCQNNRSPIKAGLRYRVPAQGMIVFKSGGRVIYRHDDLIAQLGCIHGVPIKARPFESIEFSAAYNEDGSLASAGYRQKASRSASVSSILEAAAAEYKTYKTLAEQRAHGAEAKLDARLKRLQTEVAIAEAKEKLGRRDTSDGAKAEEVMNAEDVILKAVIARFEAEKTLRALRVR